MRRKLLASIVAISLLAAACSRLERLSIVRPTAARGEYTQIAPTYEVSDKGRKAAPASARQLMATATQAYQAGKPDLAAQLARKALKADPTLADGHSLLGAVAAAAGDAAAAGKHYQQAVALAPGAGAHANNYGTWLCGNGQAVESLEWFDRALADPAYATPASAAANAGTCANRAGQQERAEGYWRQALARDPAGLQSLSGMAALQFARGRYLEARAFVERWLALAPRDPEGLQLASQIELKLGDTAASARYLRQLQAISPGPPTAPLAQ